MTIRRLLLLASVIVLLAAPAVAGVNLIAPRAGERLQGGREATLSWTADALPPNVTEWEAFLSIDGGAYYAVRVTPHLDVDVRAVTWHVPNVATTRARLMLRIGDESHERIVAVPQTFTIEPSGVAIEFVSMESKKGEAALPDGEPTVAWVSSDFVTHRFRDSTVTKESNIVASPGRECCVTEVSVPRIADRVFRVATLPRCGLQQRSTTIVSRPLLLLTTRLNI